MFDPPARYFADRLAEVDAVDLGVIRGLLERERAPREPLPELEVA